MKKKLQPIGVRINLFDNLHDQTVENFNRMFPECPLPDGYPMELPVMIGEYCGADRRLIKVGDESLQHKMFRDMLYGVDRDSFYEPEKDEPLDEMYGHPV